MNLYILDTNFNFIETIDQYESFIWTERYRECGDFEIYTRVSPRFLDVFKPNYYLLNPDSEYLMIIEERTITTDVEDDSSLCIVGRSLESILDRRIVWKQTILEGSFQNAIEKLLNEAIIAPEDTTRKISNFRFQKSTDSKITSLTVEAQIDEGSNLYDIICTLCELKDVGFKIVLDNQNGFVFSLYKGEDRSYAQDKLPYVLFSPGFDNIISSNYYENYSEIKNVVLVSGLRYVSEEVEPDPVEDSGTTETPPEDTTMTETKEEPVYIVVGSESGLNRRETYTDASDVSSQDEEGNDIPIETFKTLLEERGDETLLEYKVVINFEGEMDTTQSFKYEEDFFMGDVIQFVNEYGIESRARIDEIVYSEDETGIKTVPTLSSIE